MMEYKESDVKVCQACGSTESLEWTTLDCSCCVDLLCPACAEQHGE